MTRAKTFFVRHSNTWDITDDVKQRLWNDRKIAIRFEDVQSVDPDDYLDAKSKSAIRIFSQLANDGGYVCATYGPYDGCLIGKVLTNTDITFEDASLRSSDSKKAKLKVIALQDTIEVPPHIANRLLIGQPQQGTICEWSFIRGRVAHYVEERELSIRTVDDLLPYEQEVLCAEFLRTVIAEKKYALPRMAFASAPVGRTRKAVDITGVTDSGLSIIAQVTYSELRASLTQEKARALRGVAPHDTAGLVLFCRAKERTDIDGVIHFPIETAFEEMSRLPAWQSAMSVRLASI